MAISLPAVGALMLHRYPFPQIWLLDSWQVWLECALPCSRFPRKKETSLGPIKKYYASFHSTKWLSKYSRF